MPQVSYCYNTALSYKGAATSDAQHPHSPALPCLRCTQWNDHQNSHIMLSTVEWKVGLLSAKYRLFANTDLCIFHQSHEMEISL